MNINTSHIYRALAGMLIAVTCSFFLWSCGNQNTTTGPGERAPESAAKLRVLSELSETEEGRLLLIEAAKMIARHEERDAAVYLVLYELFLNDTKTLDSLNQLLEASVRYDEKGVHSEARGFSGPRGDHGVVILAVAYLGGCLEEQTSHYCLPIKSDARAMIEALARTTSVGDLAALDFIVLFLTLQNIDAGDESGQARYQTAWTAILEGGELLHHAHNDQDRHEIILDLYERIGAIVYGEEF